MLKKKLAILFFLIYYFSSASTELEKSIYLIKTNDYTNARNYIKGINNQSLKDELIDYLNIIELGKFNNISEIEIDTLKRQNSTQIIHSLNKSLEYYLVNGNELKAFNLLKATLNDAKENNDNILVCESLKLILEIYNRFAISIGDISYQYFIDEYKKYAYDDFERKNVKFFEYRISLRYHYNNPSKIEPLYIEINNLFKNDTLSFTKTKLNLTNALYQEKIKGNLDSSLYYLNKAKYFLTTNNGYFENERFNATQINLAALEFKKKNYSEAIKLLDSIQFQNNDYLNKLLKNYVSYWKFQVYNSLNEPSNSNKYQIEFLQGILSQNQSKNLQEVAEFETKYQTEKKEKENILLKTNVEKQQRQKRNILLGTLGLMIFGGVTTSLFLKNSRKKRLLAEKQEQIEKQKVSTLLKDQEINSINAMIEGQEKERKRIAEDLHDDIGSVLTTLKLHFENFKINEKKKIFSQTELINKSEELLDEAYTKVRSMAHSKNSGVIANQGLLVAIQNMADKVSSSNKITVEVIDHGLENRLENSLELNIFRIIQELVANSIKHANATNIFIHLTNHEDSLNIMVEDNGKGFNTKHVKTNDGMGLHSIEKRIEHMEGTIIIESEINKGTTTIIDLPL
ncbi:sensor histidine kinase [Urechidicola croceus]|uniref:Oxygen sensor histidine kinase NreB n=1 Tax=Urechidicola croceus TaxID=1850246 RepID=A0A1D8P4M9_9FLAO|nr:sensor histidine kinase [Urechidicola croceus]AOW19533.1 hypothetical protein LPB138_02050 [Urechidicola croceus]